MVGMNSQGRLPQLGRLAAMTVKKHMSLGKRAARDSKSAGGSTQKQHSSRREVGILVPALGTEIYAHKHAEA